MLENLRARLRRKSGVDVNLPPQEVIVAEPADEVLMLGPAEDVLAQDARMLLQAEARSAEVVARIADDYNENEHTPDLLTAIFQRLWVEREKSAKSPLAITLESVPPCTYTKEQIEGIEAQGRSIGYMPPELVADSGRLLLVRMFPGMTITGLVIQNHIVSESENGGWFDYDNSVQAPNTSTTQAVLKRTFTDSGREGMNLNQYIVAGQDSGVLRGKYLDQDGGWTRLLGSRIKGNPIAARFTGSGNVVLLNPPFQADHRIGGRSVGNK